MPQLDGKQIKDGTVDTLQLATDSVETAKIKDLNVTEGKINSSAVTTGKINNAAVDKDKLNTDVAGAGLTGGGGSALAVGAGVASAITVSADAIAVATDDATLEDDGGTPGAIRIKDGGVDADALATDVAGAGLTGGGGSALAVGQKATGAIKVNADDIEVITDDATLEDDGSASPAKLRVKGLGIDTGQLAAGAVQPAKADLGAGQDWDFSGADSISVPTPSSDAHAVTKAYADAIASGADWKDSSRVATDVALPAVTAAGSKIGKTLTAVSVGVLTVDGIATVLGDRILVKNQVAGDDNGIYDVTTEGTAGVAFILTRATDFDEDAEVTPGAAVFIEEGTVNADAGWIITNDGTITVDTTALVFAQFTSLGQITAGAGLTKTGNTLDVGQKSTGSIKVNVDDIEVIPDDATLENDGSTAPGKLRVKDDGITGLKLAAAVAGAGLVQDGSGNLDVAGAADKGVQVNANDLEIDASDLAGDGLEGAASSWKLQLDLKTGSGLKIDTAELAVEPNDFAGTGLEDDGSDNLRIAAPGNGLTGGAGSALAVQADGDSVSVGAGGVKSSVPVQGNKSMVALVTASDDAKATNTVLASTPGGDGMVLVLVNGMEAELKGDKSGECFFSVDAGVNARALNDIAASDTLHWVGSVAGYELAVTDVISLVYAAAA